MTTRRTLVWLILFLLTVPTVAATADAVQRAQQADTIIKIPHLKEGDRYFYDLHWSSDARDIRSSAEGHLIVEVGKVGPYALFDGSEVDVLPVTFKTSTPPWVMVEGERQEEVRTEYLRVPDGMMVARQIHQDYVSYHTSVDGERRRVETVSGTVMQDHDVYRDGILGTAGGPGKAYVNANEIYHTILHISGLAPGQRIDEIATIDGDTVYNAAAFEWTSGGGMVSCHLSFSGITYREPNYGQAAERAYEGAHDVDVWVSPDHALPRAESCESTFTDVATGRWIDTARLQLTLSKYEPGGQTVRFDTRDPLALPLTELLATEPVLLPGLPAQGDVDLLFPLDEALDVMMAMPEVKRFRDDGEVPFMVTQFAHVPADPVPGTSTSPGSAVPDPLGVLPDEMPDDDPRFRSAWDFTLQNTAGKQLKVHIERAYDGQGDVLEEERSADPGSDWEAQVSDFAKRLVPLSEVLARHASRTGTTVDEWLTQTGSRFSSSKSLMITGDGPDAVRELKQGVQVHDQPPAGADGGWGGSTRTYDLKSGAQTSSAASRSESESVASQPKGSAPPALQTTRVVPLSHVPAAATASGLAVALAFAAAYFWDGVTRFVGQAIAAPMYAKIRKEKVLDHKAREEIMTYVTENPGAALGSVRAHLGIGYGTTVHHLNTLQQNGLLVSRKVGRQRCYFPAGVLAPSEMDATAASRTRAAERFLDLVEREPGLSQQEIAARLGVADASVRYQAKRLLEHGRVRVERDGRSVRYFPAVVPLAQ